MGILGTQPNRCTTRTLAALRSSLALHHFCIGCRFSSAAHNALRLHTTRGLRHRHNLEATHFAHAAQSRLSHSCSGSWLHFMGTPDLAFKLDGTSIPNHDQSYEPPRLLP